MPGFSVLPATCTLAPESALQPAYRRIRGDLHAVPTAARVDRYLQCITALQPPHTCTLLGDEAIVVRVARPCTGAYLGAVACVLYGPCTLYTPEGVCIGAGDEIVCEQVVVKKTCL